MAWMAITRAIFVRLSFAMHGVLCIWRLTTVTKEPRYWYMTSSLGLFILEMTVTLGKKGGQEWKWFCPSVFIYLVNVVPSIWFLELDGMHKRIQTIQNDSNLTFLAQQYIIEQTENGSKNTLAESYEGFSASLGDILGVALEIRIPLQLKPEDWVKALEQILLLLLIVGRWLLPKGKLSHDQLSQLLLVYIGTAADIVEIFDAFKEDAVRYNPSLCMLILGIWSFSLIQFSLVLTATRARRDQSGLVPGRQLIRCAVDKRNSLNRTCCSPDVYGIVISIMLQDGPFLGLRLLLIIKWVHQLGY